MSTLVLVIDDEQPIRDLVARLLTEEGWDARPYASARAALQDLEGGVQPDLILLDMRMPGMDGREFVHAMRDRGMDIPVVVMTAARDARAWAEEVGAIGYVPKPFDIDEIPREVERVIGPPDGGVMHVALDALRRAVGQRLKEALASQRLRARSI